MSPVDDEFIYDDDGASEVSEVIGNFVPRLVTVSVVSAPGEGI